MPDRNQSDLQAAYDYLNNLGNYVPPHIDRKQALNTLEAILWAINQL